MGKSFSAEFSTLGVKVSSAFRRLENAKGRGRAAWRDAKALNNHAYAGHVAARSAAPRLVRAQVAPLRALTLDDVLADVRALGPQVDIVAIQAVA